MKVIRAADAEFAQTWQQLASASERVHPFCTDYDIAYQLEYLREIIAESRDVSFLVTTDGGIPLCGLRAFVIREKNGKIKLNCMGRSLGFLVSAQKNNESNVAFGQIKEELEKIRVGAELSYRDYLLPSGALGPLGVHLAELGARGNAATTQLIDLTLSEQELKQGVRKSYRSLLGWGAKNLDLKLFDSKNVSAEAFEGFRQLHISVAGRETRSKSSWDRQLESIRAGEIFLITGHFEGRLVTGGLFNLAKNYCYYGVGASERSLFHKPLSHAVIWTAILHAKAMGIKTFEMGEQFFSAFPSGSASEKDVSISLFKRGFGGECHCVIDFTLGNEWRP